VGNKTGPGVGNKTGPRHNEYIWIVPCVVEEEYIFLKTLFPSRKYTIKRKINEVKNE